MVSNCGTHHAVRLQLGLQQCPQSHHTTIVLFLKIMGQPVMLGRNQ